MKKHRHFDKDHLYDCPMCLDQSLYVHDHKHAECTNCDFRGVIKKHKTDHGKEKELHITIDGIMYVVEPEKPVEEEKICLVENNELICVNKHSMEE